MPQPNRPKVQKRWVSVSTLILLVWLTSDVFASSTEGGSDEDIGKEQTLKQKSLDPTANLKQIELRNRFIPSTVGLEGYGNLFTTEITYPIPKSPLIPVRQVLRASFPIRTAPGGPTGLGDIRFFDVLIFGEPDRKTGNWFRWGMGPSFFFPTASEEGLGAKKWQIGPLAAAIYSAKNWQIAIVVENPISFAGDSNAPNVNRLLWVPIWIYWLPNEWYLGIQGTPKSINWENNAALTFPLSMRLGKLTRFGRRAVNVFVEPEYTAIRDDNFPVPEWSVLLGFKFLFPEGF